MDKPIETKVEAERTETPAADPSEITHEEMMQVAGGQDGTAHAKPR
jgi:hypothetical protein